MFHSSPTSKIWYTCTQQDGTKAQSSVVQNFCSKGSQSLLSLPGTREKKLFFPIQMLESHNTCSQLF
jgi:hypothetical protein